MNKNKKNGKRCRKVSDTSPSSPTLCSTSENSFIDLTQDEHENVPEIVSTSKTAAVGMSDDEVQVYSSTATSSNNHLDDSVSIVFELTSPVTSEDVQIVSENIQNQMKSPVFSPYRTRKMQKIECGICFDGPEEILQSERNLMSTVCGHIFCNDCLKTSLKTYHRCPSCRKKLTVKQYHPIYL